MKLKNIKSIAVRLTHAENVITHQSYASGVKFLLATIPLCSLTLKLRLAHLWRKVAACDEEATPGVDWSECRKRNLCLVFSILPCEPYPDGFHRLICDAQSWMGQIRKGSLFRASIAFSSAKRANFQGILAYRTDFSVTDYSDGSFKRQK